MRKLVRRGQEHSLAALDFWVQEGSWGGCLQRADGLLPAVGEGAVPRV